MSMHRTRPHRGANRPLPAAALAFLAATILACRSDADVVYGPGSGTATDFPLTMANAQALPATIRRGTNSRTEVLSGTLRLEDDGDCRVRMRLRVTVLGVPSTSESTEGCRWSQTGDQLRLRWNDGGEISNGVRTTDRRVTLYWDVDTFVFAR